MIPTHAKPVLNISTKGCFARDAIGFSLVRTNHAIIGHTNVVTIFIEFDLIIVIQISLNCNTYDETVKR